MDAPMILGFFPIPSNLKKMYNIFNIVVGLLAP